MAGKEVRNGGSPMSSPKVNASIGKYRQLVLTLHCILKTNRLSVTYRIGVFINCVRGRRERERERRPAAARPPTTMTMLMDRGHNIADDLGRPATEPGWRASSKDLDSSSSDTLDIVANNDGPSPLAISHEGDISSPCRR